MGFKIFDLGAVKCLTGLSKVGSMLRASEIDAVADGRERAGAGADFLGGDLLVGDEEMDTGFFRFRRKDFVVPATEDAAMAFLSPAIAASLALFTFLGLAKLPFLAID